MIECNKNEFDELRVGSNVPDTPCVGTIYELITRHGDILGDTVIKVNKIYYNRIVMDDLENGGILVKTYKTQGSRWFLRVPTRQRLDDFGFLYRTNFIRGSANGL